MNRTEKILDLDQRFPTLTKILGANEIQRAFQQLTQSGKDAESLFHQAESDLYYLHRCLDLKTLRRAYKQQLLDETQFIQAIYEIYTAALLASVAEKIDIHVPTKGSHNCDFRVKIFGCGIYGDVKTRYEKFPFNTSHKKNNSGENLYKASRATVDPHVADGAPHTDVDKAIPESTELRRRIEQALEQLPDTYPNLVVLGLIGEYGFPQKVRLDLEGTLLGDEFFRFRNSQLTQSRHANGMLSDMMYGPQITAVAWLCLKPSSHGVMRRSGIFFNPNARHRLSGDVESILERLFDRERSLQKELDRIVEKLKSDYQPEKIIVFGSLANGDVKEGSDIDLAIIKETDKKPLDRCVEVAMIAQPLVAVNFLVYTPKEFKKEQEAGNFFVVDEILKRGAVLYER